MSSKEKEKKKKVQHGKKARSSSEMPDLLFPFIVLAMSLKVITGTL